MSKVTVLTPRATSNNPVAQAKERARLERARAGEENARRLAQTGGDGLMNTADAQLGDSAASLARLGEAAKSFNADGTIKNDHLISNDGEEVGEWLAKKNAEEKKSWGANRVSQLAGQFVPNVTERVRKIQSPMVYRVDLGGWASVDQKPPTPHGNLNMKQKPASANPFASRIFSQPPADDDHYAVNDRGDETYAYSGARGIFKKPSAASYVPEHYRRTDAAKNMYMSSPAKAPTAPGTNVHMKGGWPVNHTYGSEQPKYHVGGWSIEKAASKRPDHILFYGGSILPSA